MIIKCGRKVKIRTGPKTQTVNICTEENMHGLYDYRIRFQPPSINEETLKTFRVETVDELVRYLEEKYDGDVEKHPANYEPLKRGSAGKRYVEQKGNTPAAIKTFQIDQKR